MFGKNEVTKPFVHRDGHLLINSIFHTIQGEGPDAGRPAVFVRLAKCNLRCYFCDTEFETGEWMSAVEVVGKIIDASFGTGTKLVVLTGGEPFLQELAMLIRLLNGDNWEVSIETAGTIFNSDTINAMNEFTAMNLDGLVNKIICSPKTPLLAFGFAEHVTAWKYIVEFEAIGDSGFGMSVLSTQQKGKPSDIFEPWLVGPHELPGGPGSVYVQPMDEGDEEKNKANRAACVALAMTHGYRVSLQQHKILGVP